MPYISAKVRPGLRAVQSPITAGELAFQMTDAALRLLGPSPTFQELALIVGVCESVKLEFYRRMITPYEERKCHENGDVYQ